MQSDTFKEDTFIALDIEGRDLDTKWNLDSPVWGISFAYHSPDGVKISNDPADEIVAHAVPFESAAYWVEKYLEQGYKFVIHNAAYDIAALRTHGIDIPEGAYRDSMLLAYLMQPEGMREHSLASWGVRLGIPKMDVRKALIEAGLMNGTEKKGHEFTLGWIPIIQEYAQQDTKVTLLLWHYLNQERFYDEALFWSYYNIELPYIEVIIDMERGALLDRDELITLRDKVKLELDDLEQQIHAYAPLVPSSVSWNAKTKTYDPKVVTFKESHEGVTYKKELTAIGKTVSIKNRPFDPSNPAPYYRLTWEHCPLDVLSPTSSQLPWLLMQWGWKPKKKTESGQWATGADILEKLDENRFPIAPLVVEYTNKQKLYSTYLDAMVNASSHDGYLRSSFKQMNTYTTRLSSGNTKENKGDRNLQNIDPRVKDAFIAPPGYIMAVADLDAIELAVLAFYLEWLFGDTQMSNQIRSGNSPHDANAANWGLERKIAKIVIFLTVYGGGAAKLAQSAKVSEKDAQKILDSVFAATPSLLDLKDWVIEEAKLAQPFEWVDIITGELVNDGFMHLLLGNRVYRPDVFSWDKYKRSSAERQLGNYIIQGSAGQIMKWLHLRVWRYIKTLGGRAVFAVHDECGFYLPEAYAHQQVQDKLTELFHTDELLNRDDVVVPAGGDFHFGYNWTEAKDGKRLDKNADRWQALELVEKVPL